MGGTRRLVSDRTASLLQPAPGRPAFLIPKPDLNGLVDILAHWEAHMPAVLVSPKLTSAEQDALKSHADSISEPLPDGTAFVVFTSGTTGLPKPAILTRESLTAGARAMILALRMTSSDVLQLALSPARVGRPRDHHENPGRRQHDRAVSGLFGRPLSPRPSAETA